MKMNITKKMKNIPSKKIVLVALVYILFSNAIPFVKDIMEGDNLMHLLHEGVIAFLCIIAIYIVWRETAISNRYTQNLQQTNKTYSKQIKIFKNELFKVLEIQFEQWSLSKSEQEVALLLLKGLSLKEISQIRGTKEKTIRQQASTIYQKSNLKGRHELSAYFLEDLF
jgi:DNA-binding NarL/FixJ family response regulator